MAIFKIKVTKDFEEEQNKLKQGMEVEIYTRLPSATIYGGIEIKKAIEKKYSINVFGSNWNNENYLEIEKLEENKLQNLERQIEYIKRRKSEIVKAQLFEEAASLRDYEKEIEEKIYNIKINNKMKQELLQVYQNRQADFKNIVSKFPDEDLAGPFLMSPNELYKNQPHKLLIIGQETNGWDYHIEDLNKQMEVYESFNVGIDYYASPFWNVTRKVEKTLGNEPHSCAWTNISKFDVDAGRAYGEHEIEISKLDNLLVSEIDLLKPEICIFFTGPNFDHRIKNIFNEIEFKEIDGFSPRELSQLKHKDLPKLSFRTYHPNYLRRSGQESKFIDFINENLK